MIATSRRHFVWKLGSGRELLLGERTLLMGVLNVTPDSFSDGGKYLDPDRAFARAVELEEQGADIIDIGAESTKPGSERISEAEELRRLVPVLKRLQGKLSTPISVDTYKSAVAEKALEYGAALINEPSGLTFDPQMAHVVARSDAGLIITHMRGTPETWAKLAPLKDAIGTIRQDLDASTHRAVRAGIDRARIAIDPGLGFGKRKEQNAEVLAYLSVLGALEFPLAIGPSRKSFLRQTEEASDSVVQCATAAAVMAAVLGGAHLVRVHDVPQMQAAALIADQILSFVGISDNSASRAVPPRSGGSGFRK
jgi:dihydropteroate synthase